MNKPNRTALRNGLTMPAGYRSVEAYYRVLRLYTEGQNKDHSELMTKLREAYPEINFS